MRHLPSRGRARVLDSTSSGCSACPHPVVWRGELPHGEGRRRLSHQAGRVGHDTHDAGTLRQVLYHHHSTTQASGESFLSCSPRLVLAVV